MYIFIFLLYLYYHLWWIKLCVWNRLISTLSIVQLILQVTWLLATGDLIAAVWEAAAQHINAGRSDRWTCGKKKSTEPVTMWRGWLVSVYNEWAKNRPLILSQLSYFNVKLEVKFTVHSEAKIISEKIDITFEQISKRFMQLVSDK